MQEAVDQLAHRRGHPGRLRGSQALERLRRACRRGPGACSRRLAHGSQLHSRLHGLNRELCTVGRVQTPTLALVVKRQHEIDHFVPETYYEVHAVLEPGFTVQLHRSEDKKTRVRDKAVAEQIVADITAVPHATVTQRRNQGLEDESAGSLRSPNAPEGGQQALRLHRLRDARHRPVALRNAQAPLLSENGVPAPLYRHARYASRQNRCPRPRIPGVCRGRPRRAFRSRPLSKAYVDDTKLTDHHAIIPTNKSLSPEVPLSEKEKNIYRLVAARFLAIFLPPLVKAETVALFSIGPHTFRAKGSVVKDPGWTAVKVVNVSTSSTMQGLLRRRQRPTSAGRFEDASQEEPEDQPDEKQHDRPQELPPLKKGYVCRKRSQSLETRETRPPKPYDDASLLHAMKTAGRSLDAGRSLENDDLAEHMKESGLGTPATRAAIIERLIRTGYLERRRKWLLPTLKGIALIGQVEPGLRDPVLTARWEERLKLIEDGRLSAEQFENDIVSYLTDLLPKVFDAPPIEKTQPVGLGPCPACKTGMVRETQKAYGCSRWKEGCGFTIWKKVAGKTLSKRQIQDLLTRRKTTKLKGFTSKKTGKKFDAALALDESFKVQFDFK